jgi:hypothetical protein
MVGDSPYCPYDEHSTLQELIEQLELCKFVGEGEDGHKLEMNAAFKELKRRAEQEAKGKFAKEYYSNESYYNTHVVEVFFQCGEYGATVYYPLGGNCKGGSILDSALSTFEDEGYEDPRESKYLTEEQKEYITNHAVFDEDGYLTRLKLYKYNKEKRAFDTLTIGAGEVHDYLVGAKIVGITPDDDL